MKTHLLTLGLSSWFFLGGCRPVPVQMARVTLTERFTQSFFDRQDKQGNPIPVTTAEMTTTLTTLLGKENYDAIRRNSPGRIEELKNQLCESRGFANLGLAIIPGTVRSKENFKFFVTGNGSYAIVLKRDKAVFFTSAFQLIEEEHASDELREGLVKVRFRQQLIGHYSSEPKNFANEGIVEVQVQMKRIEAGVYMLNYEGKHEIQTGGRFIGYIRFEPPVTKNAKLIDLRGLKYVRNNY